MSEKIVVCGGGGYVGRHLVADLVRQGYQNVRAVSRELLDIPGVECVQADLFDSVACAEALHGATQIFHLAAAVGGIKYISENKAECLTSTGISINILRAMPKDATVLFSSSSCVYPSSPTPLKESDVRPETLTGYALSKYFDEQLFLAFAQERGAHVRIARLHGIYGPGDFRGPGRDHFASAMAEAVVAAKLSAVPEIKIWGDGTQRRSLLYIDDAVDGLQRIMNGSAVGPLNLASSEVVSVNSVVDRLEDIAALKLKRFYCPDAAVGAQDKVSDNTALREALSWEPCTSAKCGLGHLYRSAWDRAMKK